MTKRFFFIKKNHRKSDSMHIEKKYNTFFDHKSIYQDIVFATIQ